MQSTNCENILIFAFDNRKFCKEYFYNINKLFNSQEFYSKVELYDTKIFPVEKDNSLHKFKIFFTSNLSVESLLDVIKDLSKNIMSKEKGYFYIKGFVYSKKNKTRSYIDPNFKIKTEQISPLFDIVYRENMHFIKREISFINNIGYLKNSSNEQVFLMIKDISKIKCNNNEFTDFIIGEKINVFCDKKERGLNIIKYNNEYYIDSWDYLFL